MSENDFLLLEIKPQFDHQQDDSSFESSLFQPLNWIPDLHLDLWMFCPFTQMKAVVHWVEVSGRKLLLLRSQTTQKGLTNQYLTMLPVISLLTKSTRRGVTFASFVKKLLKQ